MNDCFIVSLAKQTQQQKRKKPAMCYGQSVIFNTDIDIDRTEAWLQGKSISIVIRHINVSKQSASKKLDNWWW